MRLQHADGTTVHLGYCTNVHPAEDLDGIVAQLDTYAVPVRRALGTDLLGLGLWLPAPVAARLAGDGAARARLRGALAWRGLEVVTLNGFPYQGFHAPVVKHAVYQPDWTNRARLQYTVDLARVLADLLPDDVSRGSVSTLPLGWRAGWGERESAAAAGHLDTLAHRLAGIERATGRTIRVGFEPEPGCVVETTAQAATRLAEVDRTRLGVCLDLAHLACAWEDPAAAVARLVDAGLPVVKVQVSAALAVDDAAASAGVLREYDEPRFLHQTRPAPADSGGGEATDAADAVDAQAPGSSDDLATALADPPAAPMRVHYHVPLHAAPTPPLRSTWPVTRDALATLFPGEGGAGCDHLDVETYTWQVLPAASRPGGPAALARGIASELGLVRRELGTLGLRELAYPGVTP